MKPFTELATLALSHTFMRLKVALNRNIKCGRKVRFRGRCIIDCRNGGYIVIGSATVINSRNLGYHLNMFAPCKLMVDRPEARILIGKNCRIHGTAIHAQALIEIGDGCLIAANTQIFDGNAHDLSLDNPENRVNTLGKINPIKIGNSVWIGAGAIILPGTTIGDGAVIAAGAVVRGHVLPRSVVAGNPASSIKNTYSEAK